MNIFKHELKNYRFTTFLWTIVLISIFALFMFMFPAYYQNKDSILEFFNFYPKEILSVLGINLDTIFTPLGYYCFIFTYITFFGAFMSSSLGLKIMLNDKQNNASEFILTKPIKRQKILAYKTAAAILCLITCNIIYQLFSLVVIALIKETQNVSLSILFQINLSLLLIQITFLFIAMVIGSYIKKPKTLWIIAIMVIIVFYIISAIESMIDNPILRYLNPFSYFKASDIIETGHYKMSFITASIFITFFCYNFSFVSYENDDI